MYGFGKKIKRLDIWNQNLKVHEQNVWNQKENNPKMGCMVSKIQKLDVWNQNLKVHELNV